MALYRGIEQTKIVETVQANSAVKPPSKMQSFLHHTLIPLSLMAITPNFIVCLSHFVVNKGSDIEEVEDSFYAFWLESWKAAGIGDRETWNIVLGLGLWAAFSILYLDGNIYSGPMTKNGHRPEYYNSGFRYYVITMAIVGAVFWCPGLFPAWYFYKKMALFAGTCSAFAFVVCGFLYMKGTICPSKGEHGSSGNIIFDYYWGLELYPRLGNRFDVKMWTNCRFGLMAWQLIVLMCWKAQYDNSGWNWAMATTSLLQSLYLAKFYWWEDGYMKTTDIITDRAGYYIVWGCLAFVPGFYTITSMYMVEHSPSMNVGEFSVFFIFGLTSILLNYWCDYQRQIVRATNGKCTIWSKPAKIIRATYIDEQGKYHMTVLLASGFWGLSRHFHYVFEILSTLLWTIPSLSTNLTPYLYLIVLTILITHRVMRQEEKCQKKYGNYWKEYCKLVPYKVMPGIF